MQTEKTQQLTQAFHLFNQLTENLTESYQGLEQQVAKLRQELAIARNERIKTLIEKEKLANQLHKLLAALPAGVIVLDATDKVIDCNKAAEDFLGDSLMGFFWPKIVEQCFVPDTENPHQRQLHNGKHLNITINTLGNFAGHIVLLTDISEMRNLQDMVNQQKHLSAMGEMVASMAHQVRTPLSTAILYSSQLTNNRLPEEKKQEFSEKILERLHFLERQVNDMLVFAKQGRLAMESFSCKEMLKKISDEVQEQIKSTKIRFSMTDMSQVEQLKGNESVLRGAIMNLLTNAIQALNNTGSLQLIARDRKQNHEIVIKDNGPGISESNQERIFEPFFTTRINGTGLGLAVVDSVLRAHGGDIRCDSKIGIGTEFILTLPCSNSEFIPNSSQQGLGEKSNKDVRNMK